MREHIERGHDDQRSMIMSGRDVGRASSRAAFFVFKSNR
jgi:tyrosyl-tRNA synthetase